MSLVQFSKFNLEEFDQLQATIPCDIQLESFAEDLLLRLDICNLPDPSEADLNAIYYVAGALVRSEVNQRNCKSCKFFLVQDSEDDMTLPGLQEGSDESCKVFLNSISRGGLIYPSDFAFQVSITGWRLFLVLKTNEEVLNLLFKSTDNFLVWKYMLMKVLEDHIDFIVCENGHDFITNISRRLFHCLIKNLMKQFSLRSQKGNSRKKK